MRSFKFLHYFVLKERPDDIMRYASLQIDESSGVYTNARHIAKSLHANAKSDWFYYTATSGRKGDLEVRHAFINGRSEETLGVLMLSNMISEAIMDEEDQDVHLDGNASTGYLILFYFHCILVFL